MRISDRQLTTIEGIAQRILGRPATSHAHLASVRRLRTRELEASATASRAARGKSAGSAKHAASGEGVSGGGRDGVREVRGRSGVGQEAGMRAALSAASRMDGGSSRGAVVREGARTASARLPHPRREAPLDRQPHHSKSTLPPPPALHGGHEVDVEQLVSTLAKEVSLDTQGAQWRRSN